MQILSWLPDVVFHLILVLGVLTIVASLVLQTVPLINRYSLPIQVAGVILTVVGAWYEGSIAKDAEWKTRVAELEIKVAQAEAKSQKVNTEIVTKVVTKIQVIKDTTNANTKYITEYVAKDLDADCRLTNASVLLHNIASQGEVPGSTSNTVGGTSQVKASELLETVTENYGTYYQVVEKLKGWQEWYAAQKKIFEETK
jgi:hypothetical protein